jgi:multicomponent Na+:H+ antiporter subunit D
MAVLPLALALPVAGILLIALAGGRYARGIALGSLVLGGGLTAVMTAGLWSAGEPLTYLSGAWAPPLGIKLRADGLSAAMMVVTILIIVAAALYAPSEYGVASSGRESRLSYSFWILLLGVWGAMNAVLLGNDLFNLYVALELLTFAGVPLVCLAGSPATLVAALRYLLFALLGSVMYLLGAVLIYAAYGTLDIGLLIGKLRPELGTWLAVALMTVGLAAKTALFPLHIWLPPAHSGAPPAASALLSGLVVKGSFFLVVRLWFDLAPGLIGETAGQILGAMGGGAIVIGGVVALTQARLKLLIAYSTVAQIGYLFLIFPLAKESNALAGGILQAISHALAKAAMFMAAGLMTEVLQHDRIADLRGIGRALPVTALAFVLAAVSLVGVPPSGGFLAKWLLLSASFAAGQWWWAAIILTGALLAGGYMFRAFAPALADSETPLSLSAPVSRTRELVVMALAICALLIGMFPQTPLELLRIGRAHHARIALP